MGTICAPNTLRKISPSSAACFSWRAHSAKKPIISHPSIRNSSMSSSRVAVSKMQRPASYSLLAATRSSQLHGVDRSFCMSISSNTAAQERSSTKQEGSLHQAFIAVGGNMGDRLGYIEKACQALQREEHITLKRTSGIWETKAMYYMDQNPFLNGVLEVVVS